MAIAATTDNIDNMQESIKPENFEKWKNFFAEFRKYNVEIEEARANSIKKIDVPVAKVFFEQFKNIYDPFVKAGGTINVWEVAGLRSLEVPNCAVLKWLLDCNGSHGQGNLFLKALLGCLKISYECKNIENYRTVVEDSYDNVALENSISNILKSEVINNLVSGVDIESACTSVSNMENQDRKTILDNGTGANQSMSGAKSQSKSRVDIVIENERFILFIEAKIGAGQGDNQLKRYSYILQNSGINREHALIYLTKDGKLPEGLEDLPISPKALSWHKLALSFEACVKEKVNDDESNIYGTLNQPIWAALAQQFCKHIKNF